MRRRKFLGALGIAVVSLSGCLNQSSNDSYTLVLRNEHDLPHYVRVSIESYAPNSDGDPMTEYAQLTLDAGETRRLNVFDQSMDYEVTASIPNEEPVTVPYGRKGIPKEGQFITVTVLKSGDLNGGVRKID